MSANVAITQDTANPYSESDLRYNPANLNQIIAGSNANAGTVQAQYYSADGGTTWHQSSLPAVSGDSFQSDPAVDWTSDGTAWALTIGVAVTFTSATLVVRCFKSVNGGKDWTFDSVVSGAETATDKPSLWVDHSPASPNRDHMYAIWHVGKDSFVSVRNGASGTWGTPLQLTGSETTFTSDGDDIKTNASGDVFAFWPSAGNQQLFVAKSTNGGTSFTALGSSPVQIGSTSGSFTIKIPAQATRATSSGTIGTLIAISGGAYRAGTDDLAFACWHDLAGGTGCNSPSNAPGTSVTSTCKTRVWFTRSINGGQAWQPAVMINNQSGLNDQFFPRLAVDELTGNLMIIYYDTVSDPNRVAADIWMQYSTDQGMTWSPAVKVTTQPTTEATGSQDNNQEFGDYIGLSGVYGRYFGCWTDRRGGGDEQIYGAPLAVPGIEFALNKATFGQDEVSLHSSWPSALWLQVNGFTNESLGFNHTSDLSNPPNPAPSVTVSIDQAHNPSLTSTQVSGIGSHLPAVTFGPEPILAPDTTLTAELQQFMYPYTVAFADQQAFGFLNSHQAAVLTLSASLTVGPVTVRTTAFLELTKGEDPFVYDLDPTQPLAYPSWLSYDLRFFTVTPSQAHQWFSVPNPTGAADAADYIGHVIDNLNNPSQIHNGDTFDSLQQDEDLSSLEFLQANSSSHELVFNYAVARVRVQAATSVTLPTVRVFFRLFQAASTASTFTEIGTGEGTYRWGSNGTPNHKIALLGIQPDQHGNLEYVTIPCFAAPRVNLTSPADMKTQTDPKNARDINTIAGGEVDTYFGCWIDQNQPGQTFLPAAPPTAQSSWDGPWTGTTPISALINAAPHQCLIAEIRYDDTPIPSGADSGTSDKLAQRNIAWIDGPNPGVTQSRIMAHPFEVAATSSHADAPDELVIDWGNTPRGSTAEIYLPAVNAHDVTGLADRMYLFHQLTAFDGHTIECPAHGVTYLPLPAGTGRYAGLISVTLPAGIKRGDQYDIVARQFTTKDAVSQVPPGRGAPENPVLTAAAVGPGKLARAVWRQVSGAFQFTLVIKIKEEVLYPEERLLAWLRWRIGQTNPANRWYQVLRHYEHIVAGRVAGFGGDPARIPPSQYGDVPGRAPGPVRHPHLPEPRRDRHYTGKVVGIAYDRFGDFEGFTLRTEESREHAFLGREPAVEALVNRAWIERFTITVTVDEDSDWPEAVILRRA